jgi:hypothetical protein
MALNAALMGMKSCGGDMAMNPEIKSGFQTVALPVALKKNMGEPR